MAKTLINCSETKNYILDRVKILRPGWDCSRVSGQSLKEIDSILRNRIDDLIMIHPTLGKTFKEV